MKNTLQKSISLVETAEEKEERLARWGKLVAEIFEREKHEILLPHKYYPALESSICEKLRKMFDENPDAVTRDIVVAIIGDLDRRIPGDKIIELAAFAVARWEALSKKADLVAA